MNKQKILNILKNIAATIVVIAMLVVIFYQNRDRDIFKFGKEESNELISSSQDTANEFSDGDIARIGDGVAFLTTTSYSVLDENAEGDSVQLALSGPRLHTEGEYAVCYNDNSMQLLVLKNSLQVYAVEATNKILTAKVNKNGYLFVATEKEGYNCECMIYNRSGEAIFKWDVSKSEFIDGDINCRNNAIAISLASAGDKKLVGEIQLIDITDAKVKNKETFDSELFYSVDFNSNDTYVALGNKSLSYFNSDGTKKWTYEFDGKSLLKADVSNHDMMVLAFSDSSGIIEGNSTDIKIINRLGRITAEKTYDGVVSDIALSDECIALAFGKEINIVSSKLREKKTITTDYSVKKVALYDDNKHLFVLRTSGGEILK